MEDTASRRNSNLEGLRIVSMLLIVAWHYATQFGVNGGGILDEGFSLYHVFAILTGSWGQIGVDLFVIISVYFLRRSNRFKSAKAIDISLQTVFYGCFWAIICFLFVQPLGKRELLSGIFALFLGKNWFVFAYLLLYVFHPVLNGMIDRCSNDLLKKATILLTIFVSGLKTFYHNLPICDFLFMVNIYFVVSYIERNGFMEIFGKWGGAKGIILTTVFLIVAQLFLTLLGDYLHSTFLLRHNYYLNLRGSLPILFDSLCIFYCVKALPSKSSKAINLIASSCFGVFLSHQFLGYYFWYAVLHREGLSQIQECIHMVYSVAIIFMGCCLLDLARQYTIEKMFNKIIHIEVISRKLRTIDLYLNQDI